MGDSQVFTHPWPGPGNSEGPVDPEGWVDIAVVKVSTEHAIVPDTAMMNTSPWSGPRQRPAPTRQLQPEDSDRAWALSDHYPLVADLEIVAGPVRGRRLAH
jgi:hypothetical protein